MRYENAQNSRFSGQSFRLLQIREYSGGLSRYFVACQSLRVFTTFPVVMSSILFFVPLTIVTAWQGRLLLPVTSSHRMLRRAFLCR